MANDTELDTKALEDAMLVRFFQSEADQARLMDQLHWTEPQQAFPAFQDPILLMADTLAAKEEDERSRWFDALALSQRVESERQRMLGEGTIDALEGFVTGPQEGVNQVVKYFADKYYPISDQELYIGLNFGEAFAPWQEDAVFDKHWTDEDIKVFKDFEKPTNPGGAFTHELGAGFTRALPGASLTLATGNPWWAAGLAGLFSDGFFRTPDPDHRRSAEELQILDLDYREALLHLMDRGYTSEEADYIYNQVQDAAYTGGDRPLVDLPVGRPWATDDNHSHEMVRFKQGVETLFWGGVPSAVGFGAVRSAPAAWKAGTDLYDRYLPVNLQDRLAQRSKSSGGRAEAKTTVTNRDGEEVPGVDDRRSAPVDASHQDLAPNAPQTISNQRPRVLKAEGNGADDILRQITRDDLEHISSRIPGDLKADDVVRALDVDTNVSLKNVELSSHGDIVEVNVRFTDVAGKNEGRFVMQFLGKAEDGRPLIHLADIDLQSLSRTPGTGKRIKAALFEQFDSLDPPPRIEADTADVGGYAWVSMGYLPEDWSRVKQIVDARMVKLGDELPPDVKRQALELLDTDDPTAIWDLAALVDEGKRSWGQKLLVSTKYRIYFDFADSEQIAKFSAKTGAQLD